MLLLSTNCVMFPWSDPRQFSLLAYINSGRSGRRSSPASSVSVIGAAQEDYEEAELGPLDGEESLAKHSDERTEIILAATFLLIVVLSFIA